MEIDKNTKIVDILEQYPDLKERLIAYNSLFSRLDNPIFYHSIGMYARVFDVAKVLGEKTDDFLDFLKAEVAKLE